MIFLFTLRKGQENALIKEYTRKDMGNVAVFQNLVMYFKS